MSDRGSREERIIVCSECRGEGRVAVLGSVHNQRAWEEAMVQLLFKNVGAAQDPLKYEYQTCPTCAGHRVVKRVKTITFEKVAPEPEDETVVVCTCSKATAHEVRLCDCEIAWRLA
jgi:DnaJ-class molecular chaperone